MAPVKASPQGSAQQYPHTPEDLRKEANYPIWVRLRSGDRAARDELVVRYAPLVKYVIGRMAISLPAAMDSDDVLSAGTVGLLHAIDRFDPDQGVRFETYALQRIRGAIIDTIRSLSPLSRGAGRRAKLLDETTAALAQRLGRTPTQEESAADMLEENELVERLSAAIESLPPRDRLVLNLYYHEELTLKEISKVIEVSESRVSQIHTAAVMKLRGLLRSGQQLARAA